MFEDKDMNPGETGQQENEAFLLEANHTIKQWKLSTERQLRGKKTVLEDVPAQISFSK